MGKDGETFEWCSLQGYMDFFIWRSIRESHFGLSDSHRCILGRSNSLQPYKEQVQSVQYTWSVRGLDMFKERRREWEKLVRGLDWRKEYAREQEEWVEWTLKDVSLKEVEVIGMEKKNSRPIALFGARALLNDDQIDDFISGAEEDF